MADWGPAAAFWRYQPQVEPDSGRRYPGERTSTTFARREERVGEISDGKDQRAAGRCNLVRKEDMRDGEEKEEQDHMRSQTCIEMESEKQ
ncbi:hypothetical protein CORC01_08773 [Colletotrichum orchidophilum]|uniref:Uncharacterized protein n=1 Tax=Colletotrichum orchidophilum TaxID=1209926 RepID=A0A1G4B3E0_9PEZI|nr:uncharacterized protein CORC01_08773 [Colletotrichum orchidophilum]OHE95921.1 hypothetical protein CORC01_08773 [Colletotrichum orchidophilum]